MLSGAYIGFYKGGCGRGAPENFFFAPTPLFAFLLSWTNFKNFFSHPGAKLLRTHPPFRIPPFWTNFKIFFSHPVAKLLRTHPFLHPLPGGKLLLLALLRG